MAPDLSPAPKQRSTGFLVGLAILATVVVVGGLLGWQLLTKPESEPPSTTIQLPASIAGMDRLYIRKVERDLDRLKEEAASFGYSADAAIYGTVDAPSLIVMVLTPRGLETEDSIFQTFAEDFGSGGGPQIDMDSVEVTDQGEVRLRCARVVGGPKTSVCMWVDPHSVGFVVYYLQDLSTTRRFVEIVRNSVQA